MERIWKVSQLGPPDELRDLPCRRVTPPLPKQIVARRCVPFP